MKYLENLARELAHKNHYPAIDILNSVSRLMPSIATNTHKEAASLARDMLATYKESENLINIGAYARGSNRKLDKAVDLNNDINNFLKQSIDEKADFDLSVSMLEKLIRR